MSKINIFGSVEDELLRIAIDKGWVKQADDLKKENFTDKTKPVWPQSWAEPAPTTPDQEKALQDALRQQQEATQKGLDISEKPGAKPVQKPQARYQTNKTILDFQNALLKLTGSPSESVGKNGPDGAFGPATANLWNQFVQKFPNLKLQQVNTKNPRDIPGYDILNSVIGLSNMNPELQKKYLMPQSPAPVAPQKKEFEPKVPEWAKADDGLLSEAEAPLTPRQQEVLTKVMKAKGLDFETAVQEAKRLYPNVFAPAPAPQFELKLPEWADPYSGMAIKTPQLPQGDEMLKNIRDKMENRSPSQTKYDVPASKPSYWETGVPDVIPKTSAFVIKELISLANELDSLGEVKAADAVDQQLKIYKEAMDKLYDITGETGEKLIDIAHPGKSTVIAPAKEEGGLVENVVEQQKKDIGVALKNPTGKLAALLTKLVSTANRLDEQGDIEGAKIVDKAIAELRDRVLPFVNRNSAFKAAGSEDKKALAFNKFALGSTTEELKNFLDFLNKKIQTGGSAEETKAKLMTAPLRNKLSYYINILDKIDIESDSIKNLNYYLANLYLVLEDFKKLGVNRIGENYPNKMAFQWRARNVERSISSSAQEINKKIEVIKQYGPMDPEQEPVSKVEKKPEPQAANSKGREFLINQYKGTLNTVLNVMNKNKPLASKALGGDAAFAKFLNALDVELKNVNKKSDDYLAKANTEVYNRLLGHLKRWKVSQFKSVLLKKGEEDLATLISRLPAPPTDKPKVKPKAKSRGVGVVSDPQVKALQEALLASGISVGKRGADGLWGPYTATAYNKFIETHGGAEKSLQMISNPLKQRHQDRPVAILPKAAKIIQYMAGKEKQVGSSVIELNGGVSVPLQVMNNPKSFVEHMQTTLGSRDFTPAAALQYLNELSQYVSGNEFDMEGKQPGMVKQWQSAIFNLTKQFQNYEKESSGQTGTSPGQKPGGPGQKAYMYPWEAQRAPGSATNEKQVAPGRPGAAGSKFGSPEDILKSLYKIRPDMFEDADLFKVKAQQLNKNPEQYLRDIYKMLGKISNALDSNQEQITTKFKDGEAEFDKAQTYLADISASLKRLADKLNTSLFEEKKETPVKPQTAQIEYSGRHEAERAQVPNQPENPYLKQYTSPMTGETAVDDSRLYGGR